MTNLLNLVVPGAVLKVQDLYFAKLWGIAIPSLGAMGSLVY